MPWTLHCDIINKIKTDPLLKNCPLYLVGDYNWDLIKYSSCDMISDYADSMSSFGLLPLITKPTRISKSNNSTTATLLDHVFSSSNTVQFGGILLSDLSDHFPVFIIDETRSSRSKTDDIYRSDTSAKNIDNLCSYLKNVSWSPVLNDSIPASATDTFFKTLENATDVCFPPKSG